MACASSRASAHRSRRSRRRLFAEADGTATVVLEDGEDGVAVGQACVFYAERRATTPEFWAAGFIARTIARQAGAAEGSPS